MSLKWKETIALQPNPRRNTIYLQHKAYEVSNRQKHELSTSISATASTTFNWGSSSLASSPLPNRTKHNWDQGRRQCPSRPWCTKHYLTMLSWSNWLPPYDWTYTTMSGHDWTRPVLLHWRWISLVQRCWDWRSTLRLVRVQSAWPANFQVSGNWENERINWM